MLGPRGRVAKVMPVLANPLLTSNLKLRNRLNLPRILLLLLFLMPHAKEMKMSGDQWRAAMQRP